MEFRAVTQDVFHSLASEAEFISMTKMTESCGLGASPWASLPLPRTLYLSLQKTAVPFIQTQPYSEGFCVRDE